MPAPPRPKNPRQRPIPPPADKIIKFQKVGDSWRFFDNSTKFYEEIARQSKLPAAGYAIKMSFESALHMSYTVNDETEAPVSASISTPVL